MSRKTTARRRRVVPTNPIALALHKAAGFTSLEFLRIEEQLRGHFDALRSGGGTRYHFAGVCTACELGLAIESRGIVRGLRDQFQAAERLLLELKGKAEIGGGWINPILTGPQLSQLNEMVDLHLFQLKQLSYGEYQAAWRLMVGRVTSSGGDLIREVVSHA
jgi:hypothetical protein